MPSDGADRLAAFDAAQAGRPAAALEVQARGRNMTQTANGVRKGNAPGRTGAAGMGAKASGGPGPCTHTIPRPEAIVKPGGQAAAVLSRHREANEWGPVHGCRVCKQEIQRYSGKKLPSPALMDVGTWVRHRCPREAWPRTWQAADIVECTCGVVVRRDVDGRKINWITGELHQCHRRPSRAREARLLPKAQPYTRPAQPRLSPPPPKSKIKGLEL